MLSDGELQNLIALHERKNSGPEEQYQILVTAPANKKFRIYMNAPGIKRKILREPKEGQSSIPVALYG